MIIEEITLFISNKKMKHYGKAYENNDIHYFHIEDLCFNKIKHIIPHIKIINLILLVETMNVRPYNLLGVGLNLDSFIMRLVSLNNKARFSILVSSCYGLYMHQYIFRFPPGSVMVTISDYGNGTLNSFRLYQLTEQGYNKIYAILCYYMISFSNDLCTPSIYISSLQGIVSLFSKIKNKYYLDLYPILKDPSINLMKEIFITDSLSDFEIETQRLHLAEYHTAYINGLKKDNDFLFRKLVKYNRKHPLQIMKDLNSLFHEGTRQTCEQKVVEYFNTLYKDYPYLTFSYSDLTSKFHLRLRINNELSSHSYLWGYL